MADLNDNTATQISSQPNRRKLLDDSAKQQRRFRWNYGSPSEDESDSSSDDCDKVLYSSDLDDDVASQVDSDDRQFEVVDEVNDDDESQQGSLAEALDAPRVIPPPQIALQGVRATVEQLFSPTQILRVRSSFSSQDTATAAINRFHASINEAYRTLASDMGTTDTLPQLPDLIVRPDAVVSRLTKADTHHFAMLPQHLQTDQALSASLVRLWVTSGRLVLEVQPHLLDTKFGSFPIPAKIIESDVAKVQTYVAPQPATQDDVDPPLPLSLLQMEETMRAAQIFLQLLPDSTHKDEFSMSSTFTCAYLRLSSHRFYVRYRNNEIAYMMTEQLRRFIRTFFHRPLYFHPDWREIGESLRQCKSGETADDFHQRVLQAHSRLLLGGALVRQVLRSKSKKRLEKWRSSITYQKTGSRSRPKTKMNVADRQKIDKRKSRSKSPSSSTPSKRRVCFRSPERSQSPPKALSSSSSHSGRPIVPLEHSGDRAQGVRSKVVIPNTPKSSASHSSSKRRSSLSNRR